jgi:hypothetical protein
MPNLELGLKFSAPIYKTGLQAMIYAPYTNLGNWAFANVFTWDVWLILGITGIGVALLMWGLEKYSKSAREYYEKADKSSSHHRVRNGESAGLGIRRWAGLRRTPVRGCRLARCMAGP